ncbi:hypothetical protein [Acidiplasma aeolicum]|jgi:predicted permease|uniref:hypothetical protein n=1 Tax=Acidiplasma aeolicum TaxID=507754 RepID=UPI00372116AE
MKHTELFLSRLLIVEQRYLAVKDTTKFQNAVNSANKQGYFFRNILSTYIMNAFTFILFSLLINSLYFGERSPDSIASFGIILFSYLFLLGIYNSVNFINTIYAYDLMAPLKSLPVTVNQNVPFISWFVYNSSSYMFVIVPSIIYFYILTGDIQTIVLGVLYSFMSLILGFIISTVIFIYMGARTSRHSSIRNFIRITFTFLLLGLFYVILENPNYFSEMTTIFNSLPTVLKYFLFPINIEYIVYLNYSSGFIIRFLEIILSFIFLFVLIFVYYKIRRRLFYMLMSSEEQKNSEKISTGIKKDKLYVAFLKKDIKTTFRKIQNLTYIFVPILFVLPFFFAIIEPETGGISLGIFISIIYLTVIVSAFYSIFLLVIEGKGIEILNSLPVGRGQISEYKTIFGMIIFFVLISIYMLVMDIFSPGHILEYIFDWSNAIIMFFVILSINIRRLIKKLPEGVTSINYYSFGRYPMAMLFIISIIIALISVVSSMALSYFVSHALNYYVYWDLPVNIVILLILVLNTSTFKIRKYY